MGLSTLIAGRKTPVTPVIMEVKRTADGAPPAMGWTFPLPVVTGGYELKLDPELGIVLTVFGKDGETPIQVGHLPWNTIDGPFSGQTREKAP